MAYWALLIIFSDSFTAVQTETFQKHTNEKRILMSDPAVIENKFQEMERKFQTLESTVNTLTTKLNAQNQEMKNLATRLTHHENTGSGGAIYVRWGRNDCPNNDTELVYSGYAGGSYYNEEGSAADYVCLPPDPQWGSDFDDTLNNRGGHMYGAEYEDSYFGDGYTNYKDDVPCAVCRSPTRSTHIMIPGRNQCYTGWTQEYSGNLASGKYGHKSATQFVCVDENPVPVPHGGDDHGGKLFYAVEGICGSLACPPYIDGRELTCVVCTM